MKGIFNPLMRHSTLSRVLSLVLLGAAGWLAVQGSSVGLQVVGVIGVIVGTLLLFWTSWMYLHAAALYFLGRNDQFLIDEAANPVEAKFVEIELLATFLDPGDIPNYLAAYRDVREGEPGQIREEVAIRAKHQASEILGEVPPELREVIDNLSQMFGESDDLQAQ